MVIEHSVELASWTQEAFRQPELREKIFAEQARHALRAFERAPKDWFVGELVKQAVVNAGGQILWGHGHDVFLQYKGLTYLLSCWVGSELEMLTIKSQDVFLAMACIDCFTGKEE